MRLLIKFRGRKRMKNLKKSLVAGISGLILSGVGIVKDNNFLSVTGLGLLGVSISTEISSTQKSSTTPEIEEEKIEIINFSPTPQPNTRVYIDGANLYGSLQDLKFKLDYEKFASFIADGDTILKYYYGVSTPPTPQEIGFINCLEKKGYQVIKCTRKTLADGNHKIKGDDTRIAIDIVTCANINDHIILVSGDGDFKYALETAKAKGCKITVVSSHSCLSKDLKNIADNIIKIEDIKTKIKHESLSQKLSPQPTLSIQKPQLKSEQKSFKSVQKPRLKPRPIRQLKTA